MIVEVAFEFVAIGEIDTLEEAFQAEVVIESKWSTDEDFDEYDPKVNWNPQLYVANSIDAKESVSYDVSIENSKMIVTEIRIIKGKFWERFNLQNFPFDVQELELILTSKLGSDKLALVTDSHKLSFIDFDAKAKFKDQQRWYLYGYVTTTDSAVFDKEKLHRVKSHSVAEIIRARKNFKPPRLVASCWSARRPGFYYVNAFFLIFLITLISFNVFSIDLNSPQFRIQSMLTILLAAISLKWSILKRLPSISYLTLLDIYQIASICFICLVLTWHALQAAFFYQHSLDPIMMLFLMAVFFLFHGFFILRIYIVNEERRKRSREEQAYFTQYKNHFMPIKTVV